MRYRREGNEMKTDSLNLPGYPEVSLDATTVVSKRGLATRFFNALGEELRRREWEAEHPEEVRLREEDAFLRRLVRGQPLPTAEERERREACRKALDTLLENIPEESPQRETSVTASGNGEDSEVEFPEVAVKEPEDWRYLFERPSVRSKTQRFLEMATRFNAKDVGFGRENDTLLVLPPEETDERCRKILSKDDSSALSKHYAGCTQMSSFDLKKDLDYARPGTMTILSDRWEGAERENVMRHELDHQFAITLRQMIENENERRRVQGLPHLSKDLLDSFAKKLTKINEKLDSLETFASTPNGDLKLRGKSDIIQELQKVERDFWKEIKNQEENR